MVIPPSVLRVEGQTCKVRHEDQAMAPASDEDMFVGSFKRTPFQNRADLLLYTIIHDHIHNSLLRKGTR